MIRRPALPTTAFVVALAWSTAGQPVDPKAEFVNALGHFSLALDGPTGDERGAIASSLDAMERALERWDTLIRGYEAAMAADLANADAALAARMRMAIAGVYLDRHRLDDAVRELNAARALDPNRADVFALLGVALGQRASDEDAASEAFRRAAALDPENPIRQYILARHLRLHDASEESAGALRRFLQHRRVREVLQTREPVASPFVRLDLVPEAAGVEPFFPPVRYAAGYAHLRRGEYTQAIAAWRDAAAADPLVADSGPHRDAMGRAARAIQEGLASAAAAELRRAAATAPDRAEPLRVLGLTLAADELHEEAAAALTRAVALAPRDERARLDLARTLVEDGRFEQAHEALRETLTVFPDSGRARYALARLYQRERKTVEALRALEAAAALQPLLGLNGIYETIGALHAPRQNVDAALAAYDRRLDLRPNDPDAHHELGDLFLRLGRHDEALAESSIALLLDPKHVRAATLMAQVHLRDADHAAAAAAARHALAIDAAHHEARYVLGTALIRLGQGEAGRAELAAFQRHQAEVTAARARQFEVEGLRREAANSAAAGDHRESVARLRQALALEPSYVSHLGLGLALLDANEPGEALVHLTEAAKLNAPYQIHRYLAAAYLALGRIADSEREQAAYDRIRRETVKRPRAGSSLPQ